EVKLHQGHEHMQRDQGEAPKDHPIRGQIDQDRWENELPRSKLRGINPKTSEQLQLDVLTMQLLIGLFLSLLLDILANGFFIAVPTNGTDKVPFGPQFAAP